MRVPLLPCLVAALACGCAGAPKIVRQALATDERGLSDLCADGAGGYLAVSERGATLVPISREAGGTFRAGTPIPVTGIPDGSDTESLAWMGGGRFAIGTERQEPEREKDDILLAERDGAGHIRAAGTLEVRWTAWDGFRAPKNRGIEALCHAGGALWLAGEGSVEKAGVRRAPLGRLDPATGALGRSWLRLTSATGRISALTCRATAGGVELFAIERHYGVARILRFAVSGPALPEEVVPELYLDLSSRLQPIPNLEGIAFGEADTLLLITDNDTGGVTGPTEIVTVRR